MPERWRSQIKPVSQKQEHRKWTSQCSIIQHTAKEKSASTVFSTTRLPRKGPKKA